MFEYEQRTTEVTLVPSGVPLYDERVTKVRIEDEAAGEYIVIEQGSSSVRIDPEEWPALRTAMNRMAKECREAGNG